MPVDEFSSFDDLVAELVSVAGSDTACFAVVEHEDEWFAVIRADDSGDPQVFVSDVAAVSTGHYAGFFEDLLVSSAAVELPEAELVAVGAPDVGSVDSIDPVGGSGLLSVDDVVERVEWGGSLGLFADCGVSEDEFRDVLVEFEFDAGAVLAEIADRLGCSDVLEGLR